MMTVSPAESLSPISRLRILPDAVFVVDLAVGEDGLGLLLAAAMASGAEEESRGRGVSLSFHGPLESLDPRVAFDFAVEDEVVPPSAASRATR